MKPMIETGPPKGKPLPLPSRPLLPAREHTPPMSLWRLEGHNNTINATNARDSPNRAPISYAALIFPLSIAAGLRSFDSWRRVRCDYIGPESRSCAIAGRGMLTIDRCVLCL